MPLSLRLGLGLTAGGGGGQSLLQQVIALGPTALYDISQLSSLYADRSATPSVPASVGGVVGTVKDLSGNNNHQIMGADVSRPELKNDDFYYLDYDGVDDGGIFSGGLPTNFTLVVGAKFNSSKTAAMLLNSGGYNGIAAPFVGVAQDGSSLNSLYNITASDVLINRSSLGSLPTRDALHDAMIDDNYKVITFRNLSTSSFPTPALSSYSNGTSFDCLMQLTSLVVMEGATDDDVALIEAYTASLNGSSL